MVTFRSILPLLPRDAIGGRAGAAKRKSFGGGTGRLRDRLACRSSMGRVSVVVSRDSVVGVVASITSNRSVGWARLPFGRFIRRPRALGEFVIARSSPSWISPRESSLPLAALSLRMDFASVSRSLRLRSRLFSFRCSFSISRAHQPASESQRCERTFSMTMSISTPALRMRWRVSFSSWVENGAGC